MGRSAPVIIDPTNPQTLFVGGEGGVFNSRDGGDHWFAVNSGLGNLSVWGLVMDPGNPVNSESAMLVMTRTRALLVRLLLAVSLLACLVWLALCLLLLPIVLSVRS